MESNPYQAPGPDPAAGPPRDEGRRRLRSALLVTNSVLGILTSVVALFACIVAFLDGGGFGQLARLLGLMVLGQLLFSLEAAGFSRHGPRYQRALGALSLAIAGLAVSGAVLTTPSGPGRGGLPAVTVLAIVAIYFTACGIWRLIDPGDAA